MTAAVVALSIACCVLALCYLPAAVGVAFLWWRVQRLEGQLEKLDEVVAETLGSVLEPAPVQNGRAVEGSRARSPP